MTVHLQDSNAKTIAKNIYEWRLPTWIEAVTKVYERKTGSTSESTFSPYLWSPTTGVDLGREIPKSDNGRRDGWTWEGNHTLRLWNWTTVPELTICVAALPAPMFKARIATAYADATGAYLPPALDVGTFYFEEGRYINADVQCSSTDSIVSTNLGEIRRVIYSRSNAVSGGSRYLELRFDSVWNATLAANDYIETMLPVPDIHANYLTLKVVAACATKKWNVDLLRSLQAEMNEEAMAFQEYAEGPRDKAGPYFKKTTTRSGGQGYDANRRWTWPWGWR